jgi:hypothetical protein
MTCSCCLVKKSDLAKYNHQSRLRTESQQRAVVQEMKALHGGAKLAKAKEWSTHPVEVFI